MRALRSRPRLWLGVQVLALAAVCAAGVIASVELLRAPSAGHAAAAPRPPLESMFQDDQLLIDSPTATVARTLDLLRTMGVDRLRLTVLWASIAPDPLGDHPPAAWKATDPAAYPAAAWAPYDRVLELARARGIGVDFDLTAPGPRWAMTPGAPVASQANHYAPSARSSRPQGRAGPGHPPPGPWRGRGPPPA